MSEPDRRVQVRVMIPGPYVGKWNKRGAVLLLDQEVADRLIASRCVRAMGPKPVVRRVP